MNGSKVMPDWAAKKIKGDGVVFRVDSNEDGSEISSYRITEERFKEGI